MLKPILLKYNEYAQNLILVNLMLVNFFRFLVTTRHHQVGSGQKSKEILPINLPDLSKPPRTLDFDRKLENQLKPVKQQKIENIVTTACSLASPYLASLPCP